MVRSLFMLVSILAPAVARADAVSRVLVYELAAPDVEARQAVLLDASLRAEIAKLTGVVVVQRAPAQPQQAADGSCDLAPSSPSDQQSPSCLVRLAQSLGADTVVFGSAASLGATRVLTLKRIRISDAAVEGTVVRRLSGGTGGEYLLLLGDAVAELFRDRAVRPEELAGVPAVVVNRWTPEPLHPALVIVGAGATLAGAAGTVVMHLLYRDAVEDANAYAASGSDAPISGKTLVEKHRTAEDRRFRTLLGLGGTAALALGTGLSFFFTDWGSDAEALRLIGPGGDGTLAGAEVRF